jgi:hypothetical protein
VDETPRRVTADLRLHGPLGDSPALVADFSGAIGHRDSQVLRYFGTAHPRPAAAVPAIR